MSDWLNFNPWRACDVCEQPTFCKADGRTCADTATMTPPMNPHQKPQEDVVVTQEDREAATSFVTGDGSLLGALIIESVKAGRSDDAPLVQAFARHRLLGHEAGRRDMREGAGRWLRSRADECHAEAKNSGRTGSSRHDQSIAGIALDAAATSLPTEPLGGEG